MRINKILVSQVRNFKKASFEFSPHLTLIIGENARGKTSLLESVYAAIYGTGFRESRELELIHWDASLALIESFFEADDQQTMYQVQLAKEGEKRVKKTFFVHKTSKSYYQYRALQTQAVLFAPQHIEIITGSPSRRRVYVDSVLSAFDFDYRLRLRNYENALRKRNKILEQYQNESQLQEEIGFWDTYLSEQSAFLVQKRQEYADYLNANQQVDGKVFSIKYLRNEFTIERLQAVRSQELRMRRTINGPQKDDFELSLDHPERKNVGLYGSRSEQRMTLFWLKLNELQLFERASKRKPLLLLDDIFSELDVHNRTLVMNIIHDYQTIATTTEEELTDLSQKFDTIRL